MLKQGLLLALAFAVFAVCAAEYVPDVGHVDAVADGPASAVADDGVELDDTSSDLELEESMMKCHKAGVAKREKSKFCKKVRATQAACSKNPGSPLCARFDACSVRVLRKLSERAVRRIRGVRKLRSSLKRLGRSYRNMRRLRFYPLRGLPSIRHFLRWLHAAPGSKIKEPRRSPNGALRKAAKRAKQLRRRMDRFRGRRVRRAVRRARAARGQRRALGKMARKAKPKRQTHAQWRAKRRAARKAAEKKRRRRRAARRRAARRRIKLRRACRKTRIVFRRPVTLASDGNGNKHWRTINTRRYGRGKAAILRVFIAGGPTRSNRYVMNSLYFRADKKSRGRAAARLGIAYRAHFAVANTQQIIVPLSWNGRFDYRKTDQIRASSGTSIVLEGFIGDSRCKTNRAAKFFQKRNFGYQNNGNKSWRLRRVPRAMANPKAALLRVNLAGGPTRSNRYVSNTYSFTAPGRQGKVQSSLGIAYRAPFAVAQTQQEIVPVSRRGVIKYKKDDRIRNSSGSSAAVDGLLGVEVRFVKRPWRIAADGNGRRGWRTVNPRGRRFAKAVILRVSLAGGPTKANRYRMNSLYFRPHRGSRARVAARLGIAYRAHFAVTDHQQIIVPLSKRGTFDYRKSDQIRASSGTSIVVEGFIY